MTRLESHSVRSKIFHFLYHRVVRDGFIAVALALIAALVWCWFYYLLDLAHWKEPVTLDGNGVFFMTCLQAVAEGDFTPWLLKAPARLGAPFISEWNSFPITEQFLFWTFGQVSKITGLPVAVSLMMATSHALAAAAFYGACRMLGKRRLFSAVFALLFALSYYIFQRGLNYITIAYCWPAPLCWAVICFCFSTWMLTRDLPVRGGRLSKWVQEYAVPSLWVVAVSMVGGVIAIGALVTNSYLRALAA